MAESTFRQEFEILRDHFPSEALLHAIEEPNFDQPVGIGSGCVLTIRCARSGIPAEEVQ